MKRLTKREYWSKSYTGKKAKLVHRLTSFTSKSFYFYDFNKKVCPFLKKGLSILEIGCAPGNILISLAKKNQLKPYGIEYSSEGVDITKQNFRCNNFNEENVVLADFFSKKFQKKYKGKFDIVCSFGFIEHFEDTTRVINLHLNLLKKGGVLILSIPNLSVGYRPFLEKSVIEKHNIRIMGISELTKVIPSSVHIEKITYFGGLFNIGLLNYQNTFLEFIKNFGLVLQRMTFEIVFWLCDKMCINLNNKYFSPGILLIGYKK